MSYTLGLTGMDQATEAALKAAFDATGARMRAWSLVAEADADYVIVDMDSMYGPMSWLRLHAAGKRVIGLTSAQRTQADFRLNRPFDAPQLAEVLADIGGAPAAQAAPAAEPSTPAAAIPPPIAAIPVAAEAAVAPAPVAPIAAAVVPPTPAPVASAPVAAPPVAPPVVAAPVEPPTAASMPPPAPPAIAAPPPVAPPSIPQTAPAVPPPPVAPAAAPQSPAPAQPPVAAEADAEATGASPARTTTFAHWLRPGALTGRARYQNGTGPDVFIDFAQRQYYGPATLKPLAAYFADHVGLRDFEQLDDRAWQVAVDRLGAPLPLSRLQWYGGLLASAGTLLPGFNPDGRFVLSKWPETEREYPRHFRIATAMMKGPSTVAEIAAASSVPPADVIDFINANLATGFAGQATDASPPADGGGKSGGLFDRLRGR